MTGRVEGRRGLLWALIFLVPILATGCGILTGSTTAGSLAEGDCFVYPEGDEVEFRSLETPDCEEPHTAQFYHEFEPLAGMSEDLMLTTCETQFDKISEAAIESLTDEARYEFFTIGESPVENVLCLIYDPAGLTGSVLAADS